MRLLFGFLGAVAGALAAVFYLGSLASDTYLANKTFESPEDAMIYHSFIYLGAIAVCLIVGHIIGRIIGRVLDWIFG